MSDLKISAIPAATVFNAADSTTGLQAGANKNFSGTLIEAFINRAGGTVYTSLFAKAPIASPAFTGNPTAPTQAPGNNSTRLANTAYVDAAVAAGVGGEGGPYAEAVSGAWLEDKSFINATADTVLSYTGSSIDAILRFKQDATGGWGLEIDGDTIPVSSTPNSVTYVTRTEVDGEVDYTWETNVLTAAGDTTPPGLTSVEVEDINPLMVKFVFNETIDPTHVPVASDFTVSGHTTSGLVIVSGVNVYVPVTTPFVEGETVRTGAYTPGLTANQLRDMSGNLVVAFSGETIDNNVIMPTLVSATVEDATPTHVDFVFSKNMDSVWSAAAAFAVTGHTVTTVTRVGATTGYLTLSTPLVSGEVTDVSYTQPGSNKMKDTPGGNLLASFTGEAIDNNVGSTGVFPYTQDFESTTAGSLPTDWTSNGLLVSANGAIDGAKELSTTTTATVIRAFYGAAAAALDNVSSSKILIAGVGAEAGVIQRAVSTVPTSTTNTFYFAEIDTSGVAVTLYKVIGGTTTPVLAISTNLSFTAGIGYELTYEVTSAHLHKVKLQRLSDSTYYDPTVGWQATPVNCISTTDTSITAAGFGGVICYLSGTSVSFDAFSIT